MFEEWKPIPSIPNYYASNFGNIKSVFDGKEHILHPYKKRGKSEKNTYLYVDIRNRHYRVHRLIIAAFNGGMSDLDVNHIDGNKLNNNINNLEWCTKKENMVHASKNGLLKPNKSSYQCVPVIDLETNKQYQSMSEAARELGVTVADISRVVKGIRNHVHGHSFSMVRGAV